MSADVDRAIIARHEAGYDSRTKGVVRCPGCCPLKAPIRCVERHMAYGRLALRGEL